MNSANPSKKLKIFVFVFIAITFILNFYQAYRLAIVKNWADSETYLLSGKALLEGTHPYITDAHWSYLYPLTLASILSPFAYIPEIVFISFWYCLSFCALLFSILKINNLLQLNKNQNYQVLLSINLLFISVIQSDFMYGQINSIILFLIIFAFDTLLKNKSVGAWFLGLGVSIKLMPIALSPFVFMFGSKRVIHLVLSVLIFTVVIPYLLAGEEIFDYYDYWLDNIILNELSKGDKSSNSFSLAGALANLFGFNSAPTILKVVSGAFLLSFPAFAAFKRNYIESVILAISLIPLTSTKSEAHHLIFLIPNTILVTKYLLLNRFIFKTNKFSKKILAWAILIVLQMMILWGNKLDLLPLDAIGILSYFFIGFSLIFKSKNLNPLKQIA